MNPVSTISLNPPPRSLDSSSIAANGTLRGRPRVTGMMGMSTARRTGLDAQREARAAGESRFDSGPHPSPCPYRAAVVGSKSAAMIEQGGLIIVGDDANDVRKRTDIIRPPRRVTTRHHNPRGGFSRAIRRMVCRAP